MIIYAETRRQFLEDADLNRLERRLTDGFERQTGGVPADRHVWADEYMRFSIALRRADVADDMQVAIEYHISAAGRSRVDVLLAGNDGVNDNGLVPHTAPPKSLEAYQQETSLAVERHVAVSTQNQALAAILFLYESLLHAPLKRLDDIVRARRPKRLPSVLTQDEVASLLATRTGEPATSAP